MTDTIARVADNIAPEGKIWVCQACGKTAVDRYGSERGWDESCMLNSSLTDKPRGVILDSHGIAFEPKEGQT